MFLNALIYDEFKPEDIISQNVLVPSFLGAYISVDVLRNYCEGLKVPTETQFLLDRFV